MITSPLNIVSKLLKVHVLPNGKIKHMNVFQCWKTRKSLIGSLSLWGINFHLSMIVPFHIDFFKLLSYLSN